jgi:hypothetical protein
MKLITLGIVAGVTVLAIGWLAANSRAATETPSYEVIKKDGDFEIRRYPALALAKATMGTSESNNSPFGKLFKFISGANERQEKIAMTAPVLIDRDQKNGSMSFIIPKEVAAKGAPEPSASDLSIAQMPGGRVATLRFGGSMDTQKESEAIERLRTWLKDQGIKPGESALAAYYDPPWTPPFMRRNEVLIPLGPEK